ncbi:MAG TPA: response regulator transcription factor [Verrucomicrobiae bacterium]
MAHRPQKPGRKIRVFLVDDHPAVRRGLELLLSREPDLEVCGQAAGARNTLKQVLVCEPDLAVVDLVLREGHAFKLIADLRAHHPRLKILVFSMHDHANFTKRAFAAGANGFVAKDDGAALLIEAIRVVMGGGSFPATTTAVGLRRDSDARPGETIRPLPSP